MKTIAYDHKGKRHELTYKSKKELFTHLRRIGTFPKKGPIKAYKKVYGVDQWGNKDESKTVIIELEIPEAAKIAFDAQWSFASTRTKMRANEALVISGVGFSWKMCERNDSGELCSTFYMPGKVVKPVYFGPSMYNTCSGGIHFFLSRKAAENYTF